ncbi:hypothetical protein FYJ84_07720 [Veillonellaceae bacterium WCA-693-APC-5D-A]|uniref:Uncharacterized protein n=1 Tax=Anaerovibrio slackiae TaxID=2652309 RepID=A0A6I2UBH2_9FIRM|nr:hypothetical protein [Anaerovibrio slackiae]MSU08868.1 hypothetical protein [Anaerovibrio slackiae]
MTRTQRVQFEAELKAAAKRPALALYLLDYDMPEKNREKVQAIYEDSRDELISLVGVMNPFHAEWREDFGDELGENFTEDDLYEAVADGYISDAVDECNYECAEEALRCQLSA